MVVAYSDTVNEVGVVFQIPITSSASANPFNDANANLFFPRAIEQAEQRIFRELDLITTITSSVANLASGVRNIAIPGSIIILNDLNVITPAATAPDAGTRNPVQRVSLSFLNAVTPTAAATLGAPSVPKYYALLDDVNVRLGPAPDAAYQAEFIGPIRPAQMSATNATTWLGTNLPDLFIAGVNVAMAAYQRDFGAMSDDPKLALSWEAMFQELKRSALTDEMRRKAQSVQWTPYTQYPPPAPPRTQ